jgi:hypothetical protein
LVVEFRIGYDIGIASPQFCHDPLCFSMGKIELALVDRANLESSGDAGLENTIPGRTICNLMLRQSRR